MNKDSNSAKILKLLYSRMKPMTAREISKETLIESKSIGSHSRILRSNGRVKKFRKDGKVYFVIGSMKHARRSLKLSGNLEEVEGERTMD